MDTCQATFSLSPAYTALRPSREVFYINLLESPCGIAGKLPSAAMPHSAQARCYRAPLPAVYKFHKVDYTPPTNEIPGPIGSSEEKAG